MNKRKILPCILTHLWISSGYSVVIYWKFMHQHASANIVVIGYQQVAAFLIHLIGILILVSVQKEEEILRRLSLNLVGLLIACFFQFFIVGYFIDPLID
ncbi:hypothetical protein [Niabella drilacis]|uniref:Uncharacterized protein n=1 Tax=Niabella drilacis (strain DSM 25811 / CCM 8410 / CCUG 62505 / LMG 26954 / E90) TaxID=1285928 RepID=A0A1G6KNM3_NIADE|nr:hypothetical protein [Niabella drilacis]SDC32669.1 hypothetical protein SAMN04487894_10246 [Niabella drilacis]